MLTLIIGALVGGITMGLLGSGGSAITVPLLVYIVGHSGKASIAESMAIVGLNSVFAVIPHAKSDNVDWPSVIFFGIPGMAGTLLGAILGGWVDDSVQLFVFGIVLMLSAAFMVRKAWFQKPEMQIEQNTGPKRRSFGLDDRLLIATEGMAVGALTGFVGVGGGFLIVPALIALAKLPIRTAIGTSLAIIAAKSVVGFWKYQSVLSESNLSVDWRSIVVFSVVGIAAGNIGSRVNKRLDQHRLKQVFATFLIAIGLFVISRELMNLSG